MSSHSLGQHLFNHPKGGFSDEEVPALEDVKPEIITNENGEMELVFENLTVPLPAGHAWALGQHVSGDFFVAAPNQNPKWVKNLIARKKAKLEAERKQNEDQRADERNLGIKMALSGFLRSQ